MPEAFGTVLLKASSEIMGDIEGCGESVGYENIESLLQESGLDSASVDISSYDYFSVEDEVVIDKGFLVITIFFSKKFVPIYQIREGLCQHYPCSPAEDVPQNNTTSSSRSRT